MRQDRTLMLALWALAGIASAQGQTAQFEVASIREIVDGVRVMVTFRSSGLRAEYLGFGIPALIAEAWNVRPDQVALAPGVSPGTVYPTMDVGRSARIYDIAALAPEGTAPTRDEFRPMLQTLLASRFKLATHTEKRDKPVYVLETNGTPKLKASSGDGPCRTTGGPAGVRTPEGQHIVATHCPIQTLIGDFVRRPADLRRNRLDRILRLRDYGRASLPDRRSAGDHALQRGQRLRPEARSETAPGRYRGD
jgi:uncharacterized protein (TIGR03435 family)